MECGRMREYAEIVNIKIRKEPDGFFVATSVELPGLVLAHKDIRMVLQDVPTAIVALYKANFDIDAEVIEAFPASSDDVTLPPTWMVRRLKDGVHV
jgi:hypothetical protein